MSNPWDAIRAQVQQDEEVPFTDLLEAMRAALERLDAVADAQRLELQPGVHEKPGAERKESCQNDPQLAQPSPIALPDQVRVDDLPPDRIGVGQGLRAGARPADAPSGRADWFPLRGDLALPASW